VEDEATGELTQYELTLDTTQAADAFLIALRNDINATVDHVSASITGGRISLQSDDGYAFGFATPYDPNPAEAGDITAATPTSPSVLDAYTGTQDLVYDFTFLSGGAVGTDTIDMQIDVRDPSGPVLRTLTRTIDADYDPGDIIQLENGLRFTLSEGDVLAGDGFSFTAYADMDTAGVLDALGLNVLFTGLGAGSISVAEGMAEQTGRLAGALRPMTGDNHRLMDMAAVRSAQVASSGTATLNGFYHALVSHIGTTRNTRSVQYKNQDELVKDLQNRRDAVSGVSVDEEMIKMIEARTIHQGALKYISLLDQSLSDLLNVL
jgi:flagellar hook-associated protein FlgK